MCDLQMYLKREDDILLHHFPAKRRTFSVEKWIASPSPKTESPGQRNLDPKNVTSLPVDACIHNPGVSCWLANVKYDCY